MFLYVDRLYGIWSNPSFVIQRHEHIELFTFDLEGGMSFVNYQIIWQELSKNELNENQSI